jgi:hypothetical protein
MKDFCRSMLPRRRERRHQQLIPFLFWLLLLWSPPSESATPSKRGVSASPVRLPLLSSPARPVSALGTPSAAGEAWRAPATPQVTPLPMVTRVRDLPAVPVDPIDGPFWRARTPASARAMALAVLGEGAAESLGFGGNSAGLRG